MARDDFSDSPTNGFVARGFRDLRVWQAAMDLVESVYLVTQEFPRGEVYGLTQQMQRAAVSVPSNIAEGQAREHLGEYLHHLSIAQGSLAELETQIEISGRLRYSTPEQTASILTEAATVARQLHRLRRALSQRHARGSTSMRDGFGSSSDTPLPIPETRNPKPRTQHPC